MIKRLFQIFMLVLSLGFATLYIVGCSTSVSDEETLEHLDDDGRCLYESSSNATTTKI